MEQVDVTDGAELGGRDCPGQVKPWNVGTRARVLTWNINGLRKVAADHGGFKVLLDQFNVDIGEPVGLIIDVFLLCCTSPSSASYAVWNSMPTTSKVDVGHCEGDTIFEKTISCSLPLHPWILVFP